MKKYSIILILLLLCSLLGGGYVVFRNGKIQDEETLQNLKAGTLAFRGTEFDVIHVHPEDGEVRLYWKDESGNPISSFGNLKTEVENHGEDLLFATNAGIFSRDFTPGGLHIENGVVYKGLNTKEGEGNFHLMPNGVFVIGNKGPRVLESSKFEKLKDSIYYGTQSGPMLVIDGELHSAFTKGSSNKFIRNGVGVTSSGDIFFAISNIPVNFYDFAVFFRDKLNCPNALYLDGSISDFYLPDVSRTSSGGNFCGLLALVKPNENASSSEPQSAESTH